MKVSVVIPARNEEAMIAKIVTMLLAVYPKQIREVIVVNDGSADRTKEIVAKLAKKDPRIKLINRPRVSGKTRRVTRVGGPPRRGPLVGILGGKPAAGPVESFAGAFRNGVGLALREGLSHVSRSATHILTLDADFIRNIPDLFDFFTAIKGYDGLIGSRYKERHSLIRYPFLKKFFNRGFHLMLRMLFGITHTDLTNNFKLYKKEVFDRLTLTADDYAVNAETGLYPILLGYNIGELPVPWYARDRRMGASKFHLLSVAPGYLRVLLRARKLVAKQ